ncbi:MAG: helix-turn-helix domain-containing protein [Acidobacteriaceae bacterium]
MGRGKRLEIELTTKDRQQAEQLLGGGLQAVRTVIRALALLQMDQGQSTPAVAANLMLSAKAVWQIGKRYQQGGMERALFDAARPGKTAALDQQQQQRIIAVVCSTPPEGRARWTVRLLTEEVVKRKLVPNVGRETIRVLLESHDLKPWREKNVVRGKVGRGVYRQDGGRAQDIRKAPVDKRTGDLRRRKAGSSA